MGRDYSRKKAGDSGRVPGGFVALPWAVLDCPGWQRLSHPARGLLLEVARQLGPSNNGKLICGAAYLAARGWRSNDVIHRALRELLAAGFLHQTVQGHRPNRASQFAVTWQRLRGDTRGFDAGAAESFRRGAFADDAPLPPPKATREQLYRKWDKNVPLKPPDGAEGAAIAPPCGVEASRIAPPRGAMGPVFDGAPTPRDGEHLEDTICSGSSTAAASASAAACAPLRGKALSP